MSALAFIKAHEGCSLKAYQDSGGIWTIGYGATGPDVHPDVIWSQDQADKRLEADVAKSRAAVLRNVRVALTEGQEAALTSFVFNLGEGALASSHLLEHVNARDFIGAAKEFIRWDHVGTDEVKGLLIRRMEEALLFLK